MKEAFIASMIALAIAAPSTAADGLHVETAPGHRRLSVRHRSQSGYPGSVQWLGHEVYLVEEGGNELFARIGYRAIDDSGRMFTQTVDCPIRPLQIGTPGAAAR